MRVEVRLANSDDAEVLVDLYEESDPVGESAAGSDQLRALLGVDRPEHVFLATAGNAKVGFAILQVTRSCFHTRPTAELTDIFVRPSYRRLGAASKLVESAIAEAEKENSLEMFLRVNEANLGAIEFYEVIGLSRAEHYVYRKRYYRQNDT